MQQLSLPLTSEQIAQLNAGDTIALSGVIYTARDAAHKRLCEILDCGEEPPFPLAGSTVYYAGPCPKKPGQVMNSCGPTSAIRMNAYAPKLFDAGVQCTIAKGPVSEEVRQSIVKNGAVYFCAAGGAGALISKCVKSAELTAFPELGTEAVQRLEVENMPLIVGIDSRGGSLFK